MKTEPSNTVCCPLIALPASTSAAQISGIKNKIKSGLVVANVKLDFPKPLCENLGDAIHWVIIVNLHSPEITALQNAAQTITNTIKSNTKEFHEIEHIAIGIGCAKGTQQDALISSWDALRRAFQNHHNGESPNEKCIYHIDFLSEESDHTKDDLRRYICNTGTENYPQISFFHQRKTHLKKVESRWQCSIDHQCFGSEILVRLKKTLESKPIAPNPNQSSCFLKAIRDTGLQYEFDKKLISTIIKKIENTPDSEHIYAINLYPEAFTPHFTEELIRWTNQIGPTRLQIEVVEGGNLSSDGKTSICKLMDNEFCFAIDDFGTSNSNYDRLLNFITNRQSTKTLLKVDLVFLPKTIDDNQRHRSFLHHFVNIAKDSGFDLCFEGVNEKNFKHQLELIAKALNDQSFDGTVQIQGFHFDEPKPLDNI